MGQALPASMGPNVSIMFIKPKISYIVGTCEEKGLISILNYDLMKM